MSLPNALTLEQGVAQLRSMLGPEHVSLPDDTRQRIAVAPENVEQVAEVLRFASANRLSTVATCGRTKLDWGNPVVAHVEMSMKRMAALREHAWQDMTCTVQAGCGWAVMQNELHRHGQMVALDPLWPDRATVGGIVATNDSGALRLKYGSLRDLIIGMTVVLADGTIARTGGKVVKNVAGYDIHKLMTGSFGTLGVVTEINFRLHPLEEHARSWTITWITDGARPERFREPLRTLMDSQLVPSSVQMIASKNRCAVDVRVAGLPECLEEYGARVASIFNGFSVSASEEGVWDARQRVFAKSSVLIAKVSVLPDEICPVSGEILQWGSGTAEIEITAQITGLMMVSVAASSEGALDFLEWLRKRVGPSGGSVVVLRTPAALKGTIDVWGAERDSVPLMREIKRKFDPNRILNPGRFVGGI